MSNGRRKRERKDKMNGMEGESRERKERREETVEGMKERSNGSAEYTGNPAKLQKCLGKRESGGKNAKNRQRKRENGGLFKKESKEGRKE